MNKGDNIEQLFKETFERFEADVNPQVWAHVQSGVKSGVGNAATAAKFTIGKMIAGAASVVLVAGSIFYFLTPDNKTNSEAATTQNKAKNSSTLTTNEQLIISENQLSQAQSNTQEQKPAASLYNSSNQSSPASEQVEIESAPDNERTTTASDNTANTSAQPEHKYGKASERPNSLLRGNQIQDPKSKSSKDNSSSDTPDHEQAPAIPVANIFVNTESGDVPLTVAFSNQGAAASLSWDFGDGVTSRENSPSHTFDKPGNYVVKLSSKNAAGSASDKINIEVKSISGITTVPNFFSPNGDGENDLFFFGLKNIASMEVVISDLNGKFIYKWNTPEGGWNGKLMNGDDVSEGIYFYAIQAMGTDGMAHSKKGSVTLNRKR